MTTEKNSSGFLKFIAFLDLIVKLLAAGALIGILVILVNLNNRLINITNGDEAVRVLVSMLPNVSPLRVAPTFGQTFDFEMTNGPNNPASFRVDN
ncbi:hypothetical protein F66182_733 [Fusarium sp. NRRL 66182]|nr:hypothetical protein F66182_733 [Fusarium sp. NRRL 66182]